MQKHLAIGQGIKILDQKNRGGCSTNPPASLRLKDNNNNNNGDNNNANGNDNDCDSDNDYD